MALRTGKGPVARFDCPGSVCVDCEGHYLVVDECNHAIRKVTRAGVVTTLCGSGEPGFRDGRGADAKFNQPKHLALDKDGNLLVVDKENHAIRKVTPSGDVTTRCGGEAGYRNGPVHEARLFQPRRIAVDQNNVVLVADCGNNCVRKMVDGVVSTLVGWPPADDEHEDECQYAQLSFPVTNLWLDEKGVYKRRYQVASACWMSSHTNPCRLDKNQMTAEART